MSFRPFLTTLSLYYTLLLTFGKDQREESAEGQIFYPRITGLQYGGVLVAVEAVFVALLKVVVLVRDLVLPGALPALRAEFDTL